MKRIGMIVAMMDEMQSALMKYGKPLKEIKEKPFTVLIYEVNGVELHMIQSGIGEIAAAAATQYLISVSKVDVIVNYGIVGGLTNKMSLVTTCVVDKVVHHAFDLMYDENWKKIPKAYYVELDSKYIELDKELQKIALSKIPTLKPVVCASADKFIDTDDERKKLHKEFGADICDMEIAAIALTCHRNTIPCLSIKSVSDAIGEEYDFSTTVVLASNACVEVINAIIGNWSN